MARKASGPVQRGTGSTRDGLQQGLIRYTVIFEQDNLDNLKDYAYTKRITQKEAINEILKEYFASYSSNPENEPLLADPKRLGREARGGR